MIFDELRRGINLERIYSHPFNIGLGNGTLPSHIFQRFLVQDRLYLLDFSRALQITASRLPHEPHRHLFEKLAVEAFRTQVDVHQYLLKSQTQRLFLPTQFSMKKIPIIKDYTAFLLATAKYAPVEVAVASLIPCFFIYSSLGLHMRPFLKENNPYRLWVESYSDAGFLLSTQRIIQTLNDIGSKNEAAMTRACARSTTYEESFWDDIYQVSREVQQEKTPTLFMRP